MSKHCDDSVKEGINMSSNGKILVCPKCGENMEFYYDDDGSLQYYCPNCDKDNEN